MPLKWNLYIKENRSNSLKCQMRKSFVQVYMYVKSKGSLLPKLTDRLQDLGIVELDNILSIALVEYSLTDEIIFIREDNRSITKFYEHRIFSL